MRGRSKKMKTFDQRAQIKKKGTFGQYDQANIHFAGLHVEKKS